MMELSPGWQWRPEAPTFIFNFSLFMLRAFAVLAMLIRTTRGSVLELRGICKNVSPTVFPSSLFLVKVITMLRIFTVGVMLISVTLTMFILYGVGVMMILVTLVIL